MNILERIRPEPQPLDAAWSAATLQHILTSGEPAVRRSRATVRRRTLASALAAAAAVAAAVVGATTIGTSPAFAVEQRENGDVVMTVNRLTDPAGLERALGDHGIEAQVTYLSTQIPSDLDDGSEPSPCGSGEGVGATVDPSDAGGFAVTFERAYLEAHRGAELSLTAAGGSSAGDWAGLKLEWSDGRC